MGLNFQRGAAAIEKAAKQASSGGGGFRPFCPSIIWKDQDEKYVLFLNVLNDMPTVDLHEWIDCGISEKTGKTDYYFGISRTDDGIGEDVDPLTQKGAKAKKRTLAVAVELEPIMKDNGNGRKRPAGFAVKTSEFTRKTDDGEETVTQPVVGVVTQAQGNFFNQIVAHDESDDPIERLPLRIKRLGNDGNTTYTMAPFIDQPVDLTNLIDNLDGVTYLAIDDDFDELKASLAELEPAEAALAIGNALLNKRLDELSDFDLYQEKTGHIEEVIDKFAGKDDSKKRAARPERKSQRAAAPSEDTSDDAGSARKKSFEDLKKLAAAK